MFGNISLFCLLFMIVLSCGSESNPFGYLTPKTHKEAFDVHLALARIYFDRGELTKALTHGEKAFKLNPLSESAAVVLGFTYLGLAAITPFGLIEALSKSDQDKKSDQSENSENNSENNSASTALGGMGQVLLLNEDDFKLLGHKNIDDPDLPVIEPVCAQTARSTVEKLKLVNKAISVICAFVDSNARLLDETRHACDSTTGKRTKRTMSHLLWAFTHLVEALAFHSVVTFSTTDKGKTNLELRVDKIQDFNVTDISQIPIFIQKLDQLVSLIDKVFPVSGKCSETMPQTQLIGLVNDLVSVSAAFGNMNGVPESLTKSIKESVAQLEKAKEKTSGLSIAEEQSKALKADFTKKMSQVIATKINETSSGNLSEEQKAKVCKSYQNISENQSVSNNIPDICK